MKAISRINKALIVIAVVKAKNHPYPILLRKSLQITKPKMVAEPEAVNTIAKTLGPSYGPNKLTQAVGKIEK